MRKITSSSVMALGLSVITGAAFADTETSSYSLVPYISLSTSPYADMQTYIGEGE